MNRADEIEQLLRKQFEIDKLMQDKEVMKNLGGTVRELEKACYEAAQAIVESEEKRLKPLREACIHTHDALLSIHVCELDKKRCDDLREELNQAIKTLGVE